MPVLPSPRLPAAIPRGSSTGFPGPRAPGTGWFGFQSPGWSWNERKRREEGAREHRARAVAPPASKVEMTVSVRVGASGRRPGAVATEQDHRTGTEGEAWARKE